MDLFSKEKIEKAYKFAIQDIRDDFIYDVLNYDDIKINHDLVISTLENQLKNNQFVPSQIVRIGVPKNYHSVRPGTVIHLIDLVVLYTLAQVIAPIFDKCLSDCVYSYRLNPKAQKSNESLFKNARDQNKEPKETFNDEDETAITADFPSGWFINWKSFHDKTKESTIEHTHVAVTDITAFFENIELDLLRETLKERINDSGICKIIDQLFNYLYYWNWSNNERRITQEI